MKEVNIKKIQLFCSTAAKFYPRCMCNLFLSQMALMAFPTGNLAEWHVLKQGNVVTVATSF